MEAANLGALCPDPSRLESALRRLAAVPSFAPDVTAWATLALEVRALEVPTTDAAPSSVGVPTWFYGHEPPNPFASHIAKFFENSIREEGVLAIATHGVIFAEGNAGTVQEIFQDACQNYYATSGPAAPMVLLGTRYWNRDVSKEETSRAKPVWPLLKQLGAEKGFAHLLRLTDDLDEIVRFLLDPGPRGSAD
jgi:hypothetical protein